MDMILTGRGVSGDEAKSMGQFPQLCMRNDRLSAYEQWSMSLPDALVNETDRGQTVIVSGETREGAKRFAEGAGRGGTLADGSKL